MIILGSLAEWRRWTELESSGAAGFAVVLGVLISVHVSLKQDHAVSVQPNVWVRQLLPE
jgi:hypothetical protein